MSSYKITLKSGQVVVVEGAAISVDIDEQIAVLAVMDDDDNAVAVFAPGYWMHAQLDETAQDD